MPPFHKAKKMLVDFSFETKLVAWPTDVFINLLPTRAL